MRFAPVVALVFAVAAVGSLSSCHTHGTLTRFAFDESASLRALDDLDANDPVTAGAGAVVLLREQKFLFQLAGGDGHSEVFTHEAIKVTSEAGFDRARVQIFWPKRGQIVDLDARTIAPDGTITVLDQQQLFAAEISGDEDHAADARFFQFPRVEVGSILELAYRTDLEAFYTSWQSRIAESLPIRDYKVDIAVDEDADPEVRIVNSTAHGEVVHGDDGLKHLHFELGDVAATEDEPFSPTHKANEPWWVFHIAQYHHGKSIQHVNDQWTYASSSVERALTPANLAGAPAIDISGCAGAAACIVRAALDKTREVTTFTHFGGDAFAHRRVEQIMADHRADAGDKAVLLYQILKNAGVDARLAGVARVGTNDVEREFPSLAWLNHTLVVAVFGDQAAWLDPSCEYCQSGYLPAWDPVDGEAFVVWSKGDVQSSGWWHIVAPHDATADAHHRNVTLAVADNGDAQISLDTVDDGYAALSLPAAHAADEPKDDEHAANALLHSISRAAFVTSSTRLLCDRARGHCARHVEGKIPRYAHVSADGIRVPLDVLAPALRIDDDERKNDVVVAFPYASDDEVKIVAVGGGKIAEVPAAQSRTNGMASVALTSTIAGGEATVHVATKLAVGRVARGQVAALAQTLRLAATASSSVVRIAPPASPATP
ncbi:MAG TPA: DUF3857 domain-containing protein [Myxococcota bacterium]